MKSLTLTVMMIISMSIFASEPVQEWESLDLKETHLKEIQDQQRAEYEDREADLQIQAEEAEIIPLESEDSRNIYQKDSKKD